MAVRAAGELDAAAFARTWRVLLPQRAKMERFQYQLAARREEGWQTRTFSPFFFGCSVSGTKGSLSSSSTSSNEMHEGGLLCIGSRFVAS